MPDQQKYKNVDVKKEALEAEKRIRPYVLETPLEYSRYLSQLGHCNVYLKLENTQRTGSFKFRGAANHILSLTAEEIQKGLITASTGNHGAAFAEMLEILGYEGTIYLPKNAIAGKVDALRSYNVHLKFIGNDCEIAETTARADAGKNNQVFIPPYNHPRIIGGQATIAMELEQQLDKIDAIFVPVGGGGLMSGISAYLKLIDKIRQLCTSLSKTGELLAWNPNLPLLTALPEGSSKTPLPLRFAGIMSMTLYSYPKRKLPTPSDSF
jgi:threonine dehydratase